VSKYAVNYKKKFPNFHNFYWNECNHLSFMSSPRNDKYNPSYSKILLSIKSLLRNWILCFSWFSFFAFWGAKKHVIHIVPFRPLRYVLKCFRCLEVSNRVRNWNKVKNFIFVVENSIRLIGNTNNHKQNNVSVFINKLSFICVLWI